MKFEAREKTESILQGLLRYLEVYYCLLLNWEGCGWSRFKGSQEFANDMTQSKKEIVK